MDGVKQAWHDSQMDGDNHTANQAELAQFNLRTWNLQPDQNMMIPELSGIHMNSSFEVSSYSGQMVIRIRVIHSK